MTNPVNILGMKISAVDIAAALKLVISRIPDKKGDFFCFSNIHTLMQRLRDDEFRAAAAGAQEVFVDGMGIALALMLLGKEIKGRVRGKDLMLRLCSYAADNNLGIAFYGSTQENLTALVVKLREMFPGIKVTEAIAPPFREVTAEEDKSAVERINKSGAGILFVALNSPRQEEWMGAHKGKIGAVQLSVGAAFDFITGRIAEAPKWMQDASLEWFFRMFQQPAKVIRRMSLVPEFTFRLLLQMIKEKCLGIKEAL